MNKESTTTLVKEKDLVKIPNDVENVTKWVDENRTEIHSKIVNACEKFIENANLNIIVIAMHGDSAFGIRPSAAPKALTKAMEWFTSSSVEEYEKAAKARDLINILNAQGC